LFCEIAATDLENKMNDPNYDPDYIPDLNNIQPDLAIQDALQELNDLLAERALPPPTAEEGIAIFAERMNMTYEQAQEELAFVAEIDAQNARLREAQNQNASLRLIEAQNALAQAAQNGIIKKSSGPGKKIIL